MKSIDRLSMLGAATSSEKVYRLTFGRGLDRLRSKLLVDILLLSGPYDSSTRRDYRCMIPLHAGITVVTNNAFIMMLNYLKLSIITLRPRYSSVANIASFMLAREYLWLISFDKLIPPLDASLAALSSMLGTELKLPVIVI
jgi:hypothetical protein